MEQSILLFYLIGANILGFALSTGNVYLFQHTRFGRIDGGLAVIAVAGGALGVLLGLLALERKAEKENMMLWVITICAFIVEIVGMLFFFGNHQRELTVSFFRVPWKSCASDSLSRCHECCDIYGIWCG